MKHRDTSFSLIFIVVIMAHVGVIGWLIFGQGGCQQELAAADTTQPEESAVQLNLSLPDRVSEPSARSQEGGAAANVADAQNDPESRLTLPKSPVAQVPTPEPIVVDDTAEKEREAARKREEAKQAALLAQQRKRAEEAEARLLEAERAKEREVAAAKAQMERAAKKALAEQQERERALAKREAEAQRLVAEREREANAQLLAERRAAEAKVAEERKRQEIKEALQREVARKLEEDRLADEARARQAAEVAAAAREQRLEEDRRARARAEEARILDERLEREVAEARRIERARVVEEPVVVPAKPVGEGAGAGIAQVPNVVPAKPVGGARANPAPGVVDMAGYRSTVEKMIRGRWTVPKGIAVDQRPEVVLRINRAGKVVYSRLSQQSGNPNLDRSAINAVRIGSRLIPLPPGYEERLYEVKVKFEID